MLIGVTACQRIAEFDRFRLSPGVETESDARETCLDFFCYAPPPNECTAGGRLRVWNPTGYCIDEKCVYEYREEPCYRGDCESGICQSNPCQGFSCVTPPKAECVNETVLTVFDPVGRCIVSEGQPQCAYSERQVSCTAGCRDDICAGDPCAATTCNLPPARFCNDHTASVYESRGRCTGDGSCVYTRYETECTGSCEKAWCAGENPCRGIACQTPRANYCLDSNTLQAFDFHGACEEGNCLYPGHQISCAGGCQEGQCQDSPCQGISCNPPPPSICLDSSALQIWDGQEGACVEGKCSFGRVLEQCALECINGACREDPCAGKICNNPSAPYCDGRTLVTFAQNGVCREGGLCFYNENRITCFGGCKNAQCLPQAEADSESESRYLRDHR